MAPLQKGLSLAGMASPLASPNPSSDSARSSRDLGSPAPAKAPMLGAISQQSSASIIPPHERMVVKVDFNFLGIDVDSKAFKISINTTVEELLAMSFAHVNMPIDPRLNLWTEVAQLDSKSLLGKYFKPGVDIPKVFISLNNPSFVVETKVKEEPKQEWTRGFALAHILKSLPLTSAFTKFLGTELSAENVQFWFAVQEFKDSVKTPDSKLDAAGKKIWDEYIDPTGDIQYVNLASTEVGPLEKAFRPKKGTEPAQVTRTMFDEGQRAIFKLMESDSYARFLKHETYRALFESGLQAQDLLMPIIPESIFDDVEKALEARNPKDKKGGSLFEKPVVEKGVSMSFYYDACFYAMKATKVVDGNPRRIWNFVSNLEPKIRKLWDPFYEEGKSIPVLFEKKSVLHPDLVDLAHIKFQNEHSKAKEDAVLVRMSRTHENGQFYYLYMTPPGEWANQLVPPVKGYTRVTFGLSGFVIKPFDERDVSGITYLNQVTYPKKVGKSDVKETVAERSKCILTVAQKVIFMDEDGLFLAYD
jgi:hypothetical protein